MLRGVAIFLLGLQQFLFGFVEQFIVIHISHVLLDVALARALADKYGTVVQMRNESA
jgi:hypothetical protein